MLSIHKNIDIQCVFSCWRTFLALLILEAIVSTYLDFVISSEPKKVCIKIEQSLSWIIWYHFILSFILTAMYGITKKKKNQPIFSVELLNSMLKNNE